MAAVAGLRMITYLLVTFIAISIASTSRVPDHETLINLEHTASVESEPNPHSNGRQHGRQLLQSGVQGVDVSAGQSNYDWQAANNSGVQFAYIKATEGTGYTNPAFTAQYDGSYNAGIIRGAYHFGRPDVGDGASQATYFVQNGGGWSADGKTLPGALDIEYNYLCGSNCTASQTCWSLSQADMAAWISAFVTTYFQATGVYPVIYSTYNWYNQCVGTLGDFSANCPFWIACPTSDGTICTSGGTLPYNWGYYTFWQYQVGGSDLDVFNGPYSQLQVLANNG